MDHSVDIQELQRVVGKYVQQYNLVVAAGPVTGVLFVKTFISNNKVLNTALVAGGAWFVVQEMATPIVQLIGDQFGYLQSLLGSIQ